MGLRELLVRVREVREGSCCSKAYEEALAEFGGDLSSLLEEVETNEMAKSTPKTSRSFDACVGNTLRKWEKSSDDAPPKRKGKPSKYKTAGEAARAVCAWIGSRTEPGAFKGKKPFGKG